MLFALLEAVLDSLRLLPFLFVTYLIMEFIEQRMGDKAERLVRRAGKLGPVCGSALGVIPQCGFSAAASSLFSGRVITLGTLIAVYLSTSDEMLPVMLSEAVPVSTILGVLAFKFAAGAVFGFVVDAVFKSRREGINIKGFCERENCKCEEGGILKAALKHTVSVYIFVLLVMAAVSAVIYALGEENIAAAISGQPLLGELAAGAVGLIPNCSASVVITQLYIEGLIGAGPLISGLLTGAGVGLLVLFRTNRQNLRQNLRITALLYIIGVVCGMLVSFFNIKF